MCKPDGCVLVSLGLVGIFLLSLPIKFTKKTKKVKTLIRVSINSPNTSY